MSWPHYVLRQFEKLPQVPSEVDFHGPCNKLLCSLFPFETSFTVVPQSWPGLHGAASSVVTFEVKLEDRIVLMLEMRPPDHLIKTSKRAAADRQIRERMSDIDCPIPMLHAVCALGTKLCFYTQSCNGRVLPHRMPSDPKLMLDPAPKERWDCDILEDDGAQRFRAVVEEIMQACAML